MNIRDKKYTIDMTTGPILGKLLRFILPLALSGMLQLFYNAADIIVVGRYAGSTSLAAVGSTGALVNLLVNLFVGLSVGASVISTRSSSGAPTTRSGKPGARSPKRSC